MSAGTPVPRRGGSSGEVSQGLGVQVAEDSGKRWPLPSWTSTQREPSLTSRNRSGRPMSRPWRGVPSGPRARPRSTISVLSRVRASSANVRGAPCSASLTTRRSSARLSSVGSMITAATSGARDTVAQAAASNRARNGTPRQVSAGRSGSRATATCGSGRRCSTRPAPDPGWTCSRRPQDSFRCRGRKVRRKGALLSNPRAPG